MLTIIAFFPSLAKIELFTPIWNNILYPKLAKKSAFHVTDTAKSLNFPIKANTRLEPKYFSHFVNCKNAKWLSSIENKQCTYTCSKSKKNVIVKTQHFLQRTASRGSSSFVGIVSALSLPMIFMGSAMIIDLRRSNHSIPTSLL